MESKFTVEEKKKYMLKKHIKDHLFEYILDFICPIILALLLLYIGKAQEYISGLVFTIAYSSGRIFFNLRRYKKEYMDIDIK